MVERHPFLRFAQNAASNLDRFSFFAGSREENDFIVRLSFRRHRVGKQIGPKAAETGMFRSRYKGSFFHARDGFEVLEGAHIAGRAGEQHLLRGTDQLGDESLLNGGMDRNIEEQQRMLREFCSGLHFLK